MQVLILWLRLRFLTLLMRITTPLKIGRFALLEGMPYAKKPGKKYIGSRMG